MNIGYARVSTTDQDCQMQIKMLEKYPCEKIYFENLSGKNTERPELQKLLKALKPDDVLVVYKLDRLSRSVQDTFNLLSQLNKLGAKFKSLTECFDTTVPQGKMLMQMLAVFAEFERDMIRERVIAGVRNAQRQGVKFGRPETLNQNQKNTILYLYEQNKTQKYIADQLRVAPSIISRFMKTQLDVKYKAA